MVYAQTPEAGPLDRAPNQAPTAAPLGAQATYGNQHVAATTPLATGDTEDPDLLAQHLAFDAQDYHLQDYTPSTGLGCFDAAYDPVDGEMSVTLRLAFDFAPAAQAGWWAQAQDWLGIEDGWTPQDKAMTIQAFVEKNQKTWSDRYRFQCVRPGWERYQARVQVHLEVVDDPEEAHYTVRMEPDPGDLGVSDNTSHEARGYVDGDTLRMNEGLTKESKQSITLAEADLARLQEGLPADPIPLCATPQGDLSPTARGVVVLDRATVVLQEGIMPSTWKPEIWATGRGPQGVPASRREEGGQVVADWLRAGGVSHPVTPVADDAPVDQLQVTLAVSPQASPRDARFRQTDLQFYRPGHEVGHLFGLNDEYDQGRAGTPDQIAAQRAEDARLAARSGTTAPPSPATTPSIMSKGPDVLPFHYSTFHEALAMMTAAALRPSDWRVGEVPRPTTASGSPEEEASW